MNAGDLKIKVLGTEFNVKAYKDASTVSATLVRGAIEATTPGGTYRQYPDQKLVFSRVNGTTQIVDVEDSGMASSWKEGILYYDNQSLGEIAEAHLRQSGYCKNEVFRQHSGWLFQLGNRSQVHLNSRVTRLSGRWRHCKDKVS